MRKLRPLAIRITFTLLACASVSGIASCHLLFGYDDFVDEAAGGQGGEGATTAATTGGTSPAQTSGSGTGTNVASTSASTGDGSSSTGVACVADGVCDMALGETCGTCASDCACTADQQCTPTGCELRVGAACASSGPCASDACCLCPVAGGTCVNQASDCSSPGCVVLQ